MQEKSIQRIQDFLRKRLDEEGTINQMMNMQLVSIDQKHKKVTLSFPVEKWQLNPAGNMHGGMISTALDITMGCVAYVFSEADFTPTVQMSINFNASIKQKDTLLVEGICDHGGSRLTQVRAIAIVSGKEHVVASANGSYAINKKV